MAGSPAGNRGGGAVVVGLLLLDSVGGSPDDSGRGFVGGVCHLGTVRRWLRTQKKKKRLCKLLFTLALIAGRFVDSVCGRFAPLLCPLDDSGGGLCRAWAWVACGSRSVRLAVRFGGFPDDCRAVRGGFALDDSGRGFVGGVCHLGTFAAVPWWIL